MPGQDYIECSSFTFTAGSKIKDLPVKEFSNMGMDAPPTDHVAGSGKSGEKTMHPRAYDNQNSGWATSCITPS